MECFFFFSAEVLWALLLPNTSQHAKEPVVKKPVYCNDITLVKYSNLIFPMWAEIILYFYFFSFKSMKSFQNKRFIQTACFKA